MTAAARSLALVLAIICFVWMGAALAQDFWFQSLVLIVLFLILMRAAIEGRVL